MQSLKTNRDFERVFRKGRSAGHPDLVILGRKCRPGTLRVGFCISRKTGKAVQRNRLRRRLKEILREYEERLEPKWELVIVGKPNSTQLSYARLKKLVAKLLTRLKVMDS